MRASGDESGPSRARQQRHRVALRRLPAQQTRDHARRRRAQRLLQERVSPTIPCLVIDKANSTLFAKMLCAMSSHMQTNLQQWEPTAVGTHSSLSAIVGMDSILCLHQVGHCVVIQDVVSGRNAAVRSAPQSGDVPRACHDRRKTQIQFQQRRRRRHRRH